MAELKKQKAAEAAEAAEPGDEFDLDAQEPNVNLSHSLGMTDEQVNRTRLDDIVTLIKIKSVFRLRF